MDLQPVKGTRDFFPEQMRQRNWLFDVWRKVSLQSGFEEYDTCVLEHEELYIRKAGDEISQQLYSFEDKSGRRLSLRPEMTPSLARMILQHQRSLPMPVRWFSIPQCFRYERMTKGRRREHFQWNADIIGQSGVTAEAEILLLLINACREMGLTDAEFRIFLNDRRILNSILEKIEVPPNLHDSVLVIMDKRDKVSPENFSEMLVESGMNSSQVEQLKEHLAIPELESLSKLLPDCEGITALQELSQLINISGFSSYIQFDVSIVRGLSYYTGPVFEMNHPQKSHRAICGGGRYDSLLSTYGGETIPAVGFGFGDVVILDVLEEHGRSPDLSRKLDFTIIPFDSTQVGTALKLAGELRNLGWSVECNFGLRKMKKALQQASESGADRALLLFPEELERNEVVVRDMKLREQSSLQLEKLLQMSPEEQT